MNHSFAQAVKLIAMYLPQYHAIPENDRWWGKGFTEWTNVRKAEPRFPGHCQPQEPGELGYYDLRDPAARQAQAALAREYGIHGFCYYHYWFNGKRLLETPFNEVLASGKPDFPFCLCWANENWTRRWDGLDQELLMSQEYSDTDSVDFIRDLFPVFRDNRYIRVNGKPLLLVYRTSLLPDPKRTAEIWREEMRRADMGELYLVRVENMTGGDEIISPYELGFDAAMEFAPSWGAIGRKVVDLAEVGQPAYQLPEDMSVYDYERCMHAMMRRPRPDYKLFRGVFPSWDNTARRKSGATLFINNSPAKYAYWLATMLGQTIDTFAGDERFLFVNAWNEWGEGCHLEPDRFNGTGYLEATRLALRQADDYASITSSRDALLNLDEGAVASWFEGLDSMYCNAQQHTDREFTMLRVLSMYLRESTASGQKGDSGSLLNELLQQKEALDKDLRNSQTIINDMRNSLIWRVTGPIRSILDRLVGK